MASALPCRTGRVRVGDGLRLFYRDYEGGPGVPLLCLPGLTRNGLDFDAPARRLRAGRRVIALDLRGRGNSDWDPSGRSYRPQVYIDDIRHAAIALGLGRFAVCGTSLGGFLAMGMAVMMPTALAGVVLNDAGPDPDLATLDHIKAYMRDLTENPPKDWPGAVASLKAGLPDIGLRSDEEWEDFARGTFRESGGRETAGGLTTAWDPAINESLDRGGPLPDLWPVFGALRPLPVLLFRGENSNLLRPETAQRMTALHPGLETITVPRAGHTPSLRETECQEPLDAFLARLDRRGDGHA